ncbi:hypothetical protein HDV06_002757 [Boothiomyces sp. JEL0866]|nr:hypothetical protein HDV06_002757 [Boothiomyces sp. JEL0866]
MNQEFLKKILAVNNKWIQHALKPMKSSNSNVYIYGTSKLLLPIKSQIPFSNKQEYMYPSKLMFNELWNVIEEGELNVLVDFEKSEKDWLQEYYHEYSSCLKINKFDMDEYYEIVRDNIRKKNEYVDLTLGLPDDWIDLMQFNLPYWDIVELIQLMQVYKEPVDSLVLEKVDFVGMDPTLIDSLVKKRELKDIAQKLQGFYLQLCNTTIQEIKQENTPNIQLNSLIQKQLIAPEHYKTFLDITTSERQEIIASHLLKQVQPGNYLLVTDRSVVPILEEKLWELGYEK